jgi:hypothetical protein
VMRRLALCTAAWLALAGAAVANPSYEPPFCAECAPGPGGSEAPARVAPQTGLEAPPSPPPSSYQPMPEPAPLPVSRPSRAMPPPGYPIACPWPPLRGTICTPDGLTRR